VSIEHDSGVLAQGERVAGDRGIPRLRVVRDPRRVDPDAPGGAAGLGIEPPKELVAADLFAEYTGATRQSERSVTQTAQSPRCAKVFLVTGSPVSMRSNISSRRWSAAVAWLCRSQSVVW